MLAYNLPKKRKKTAEKATQCEECFVNYRRTSKFEIEVNVDALQPPRFICERPSDIRNEYFASLVAFELEKIRPEERSYVYGQIINTIRSCRGENVFP